MANWIHDIEIKNFKSIRHAKVEDCRRINVFIGYPNVGKSNLIESLSLFSIDSADTDFSAFVRIKNLTTIFHDGNVGEQSEIRINDKHRVVVNLEKDVLAFKQQFEREGTSFAKKDGRVHFSDDSHDVAVKRHFQIKEDKKTIFEYKETGIGRANELQDIKKYEFNKRMSYTDKGYSSLSSPYGENIFNIISTNPLLKSEVTKLFKPNNLELVFDTRLQEFAILKRTESGIFSLPYELVADTLQRLIFYKSAVLSNKGKTLLFEEPEAHMFPPYISKLTGEIWYNKDNQYFMATHSPFVINDFLENARDELAIYVLDYQNGETIVKRLTEEQIHEAYQYGLDLFLNVQSLVE